MLFIPARCHVMHATPIHIWYRCITAHCFCCDPNFGASGTLTLVTCFLQRAIQICPMVGSLGPETDGTFTTSKLPDVWYGSYGPMEP